VTVIEPEWTAGEKHEEALVKTNKYAGTSDYVGILAWSIRSNVLPEQISLSN